MQGAAERRRLGRFAIPPSGRHISGNQWANRTLPKCRERDQRGGSKSCWESKHVQPFSARPIGAEPSRADRSGAGRYGSVAGRQAPVGTITANAAFYRDFAPGTYSFTVQPYGFPTGDANKVQLSPGSQTYLQIAWVATWQEGYALADKGDEGCDFFVLNMAPELARAYLPGLTPRG